MMALLDNSPLDFIINSDEQDLERIVAFVHRTFNSLDFIYFLKALKSIYVTKGGLESILNEHKTGESLKTSMHNLYMTFFELPLSKRTERHVSDPFKGSAAKKLFKLR